MKGPYALRFATASFLALLAALALASNSPAWAAPQAPFLGPGHADSERGSHGATPKTNGADSGTTVAILQNQPPRVADGLQVLYRFDEGSGNRVFDVSNVGTPIDLTIANPAAVTWGPGTLSVSFATTIVSTSVAGKLNAAIPATGALSIEAWVSPSNTTQTGPSRIVSLSLSTVSRNFTLGQGEFGGVAGNVYGTRLRTTATGDNGLPSVQSPGGSLTTEMTHVVYTRAADGQGAFYIDGKQASTFTVAGSLSNWSAAQRLSLANEITGDRPWLGTFELVAVYDRALTAAQVLQNFKAGDPDGNGVPPVRPLPPPPMADFGATPLQGTAPLSVSFTDLSTGNPNFWSWSFGDGATSTEQSPEHVYSAPGRYTVTLVTANHGGSGTALKTDWIQVLPSSSPPLADFSATPLTGTAPLSVAFADLSTGVPSSWSWSFGDGTTSTEQSPEHVYSAPGRYTVTLVATNAFGSGTASRTDLITVQAEDPTFAIEFGMNSSVNRWSQRSIAFADAMARALEFTRFVNEQSTPVLAPILPLGQSPALLGAGWPNYFALAPGERPCARLFSGMQGTLPDGRVTPYVLTWEGTGSCRLAGPPVLSEANRTANRVEVFVDPTAGDGNALLVWVEDLSSATDPVRDAHVWLPGMEAQKPILWPPFVTKLQAMNLGRGPHTWRSLDWCSINEYGRTSGPAAFVFDLAGRIKPDSPSQGTRRGVCPEFQVALCNAVGANLHFLVPHQANQISDADYETFIRDALTVIRDGSPAVPGVQGGQPFGGLDPDLTLTVEYSNEVWNPGFPVYSWLQDRARANGLAFHQQIAREIERVFALAGEVFAGPHRNRLRTYVGGSRGNIAFLDSVLAEVSAGVHVDAIGPGGYFAPGPEDISAWLLGAEGQDCPNCPTPVEVIDSARMKIPELALQIRAHRQLADSFVNPDGSSPALELYEAGQAFVPGFQPWGASALVAQTRPEMYDAYVLDLIPMFVQEGVDLILFYSFMSDSTVGGAAGPFGHWESMDQTLTLPVPEMYLDEGVPKAAAIYKGPPLRAP